MEQAVNAIRNRLDRAGILLSGVCALHCILGIILVSTFGIGSAILFDPLFHEAGLALALVLGILSLGFGYLRHGRGGPLALGMIGLTFMALAIAADHGWSEAPLTVLGVVIVAAAHLRNLRAAS